MTTHSRVVTERALPEQAPVREKWGVIGGMGPFASAEFIKTIYELAWKQCEQEMPEVMLLSDPTMPDRTKCFREGYSHILAQRLEIRLRQLESLGVTNIVVCCLTIHHVLHSLPANLRRKILSLVELIHSAVIRSQRMHLLLCTSGAREMRVFESHPLWEQASRYIRVPSATKQDAVHQVIYRIKRNIHRNSDVELLQDLLARYETDALIGGCTEFHLLAKRMLGSGDDSLQWLDPLQMAATRIVHGMFREKTTACTVGQSI